MDATREALPAAWHAPTDSPRGSGRAGEGGGEARSVRWAACGSGGFKSLRCSDGEHRIQKWGNASLAVACGLRGGGQGVHREVESEGYEEQYRAVIEGAIP